MSLSGTECTIQRQRRPCLSVMSTAYRQICRTLPSGCTREPHAPADNATACVCLGCFGKRRRKTALCFTSQRTARPVVGCSSLRSKQQDCRPLCFTSQQATRPSPLVLHFAASRKPVVACAPSTPLRRASLRRLCILANEYGVPAIARFSGSECAGHAPSQRYVYCTHSSQALRAHFTTKEPTHNATPPLQMSHKCQCTVLLLITRLYGPSLPFFFSASLVPHELAAADAPCIHNTNACHAFTL